MIEWARQLQSKDTIALDIGAHVGDWAVDMAEHSAQVLAFEAQSDTFNLLRTNLAPYPNAKPHHVALNDQPGWLELAIISEDGGGSSTRSTPMHEHPRRVERVRAEPLDAYGLCDVGLVKIDVEGAELAVIRGAIETLRRSRWPKILFEAWSYSWYAQKRAELFDFLKAIGYEVKPLTWPDMFIAER